MTEIDDERARALWEFAEAVRIKLSTRKNVAKSDWREMDVQSLRELMSIEAVELSGAMERLGIIERMEVGDRRTGLMIEGMEGVADECLDIAAFAFFIWDVIRRSEV